MIHGLKLHQDSGKVTSSANAEPMTGLTPGSSDSPDSLVTQVRNSAHVSPAGTPLEHHSGDDAAEQQLVVSPLAANASPITAEKAQSIYPPEASVFVAK